MQPVARPAVPAWTRWFVAAFLGVFVGCGVAGIEAWPLTGWRLFADARQPVQVAWQAVTVDGAGRETPVPFRDLPVGFHGNVQVLKGFAGLTAGEQAAVCRAWADAVRARGGQVEAVRVYRTVTDVSRRVGDRGAPPARELRWTCGGPGGSRSEREPAPQEPAARTSAVALPAGQPAVAPRSTGGPGGGVAAA